MGHRDLRAERLTAILVALLLSTSASAQQDELARESNERVADMLTALGARNGAHIADLGSSDGFYTVRIAKAVAPNGRAYAVDISSQALDRLKARAEREGITNIESILSAPADPTLPAGMLDAVLIRTR